MDSKRLFARDLRNGATDAERLLWRFLRNRQLDGFRFRRQVPLGVYVVDFVCPQAKLVVELDGGQHGEQVEHDRVRTQWLGSRGYRVLRFWNHEVMQKMDAVVDEIHRELTRSFTPPQPSPSLCEREGAHHGERVDGASPQPDGPGGRSSPHDLPQADCQRGSSPPPVRERVGAERGKP